MSIDWLAYLVVAVVTLVATLVVVGLWYFPVSANRSGAIRAGPEQSGKRRTALQRRTVQSTHTHRL